MKPISLAQKKLIRQKQDILYKILVEDSKGDYQACEEALNILLNLIGDVDLTLVRHDGARVKLITTTLTNDDNINALLSMVKHYLLTANLKENVRIRARPDVYVTKTIKLSTGENVVIFLMIDIYNEEDFFFDEEVFKEILELLSLIVRICVLEEERKLAYKIDSLTHIFTRDTLIKDIKSIISLDLEKKEDSDAHLAILYLINGSQLNTTEGSEYVDECLMKIAMTLLKYVKIGGVYRIGGMKFAMLLKKNTQNTVFFLQDMIGKVMEIDANFLCSGMVVPIMEDAYKTVYTAERHLKELGKVNVVTVFRGTAQDFSSFDYEDHERFITIEEPTSVREVDYKVIHDFSEEQEQETGCSLNETVEVIPEVEVVTEDTANEQLKETEEDENDGTGITLDFEDEEDDEDEEESDKLWI